MSNAVKTLPAVVVGTSAVTIDPVTPNGAVPSNGFTHRHWALSVSIQSDPGNSGLIYVGDNLVSTSRYSRVLNPGEWYTVQGSAVDPNRIYVLSDTAAQVVHPSWN